MTNPSHMVTVREAGPMVPCDGEPRRAIAPVAAVVIETPHARLALCDRCADALWASLTFRRDQRRAEKRKEAA